MAQLKSFWRKVFGPKDFDFQLLSRSGSSVELHYYNRNARLSHRRSLPRYYSHHDELSLKFVNHDTKAEDDGGVEILSPDQSGPAVRVVFAHFESSRFPTLLSHIPEDVADQDLFNPLLQNPALDSALATCHLYRQRPAFQEGILLKCLESQGTYPYVHYIVCEARENEFKSSPSSSCPLIKPALQAPGTKLHQGSYQELFSIVRSGSGIENRLPTSRYSGYIVIGFKVLGSDDHRKLEKAWLTWSGAREIYKYCPRTWNLKRITLHRSLGKTTGRSPEFAYVLFCEFANILHPANLLQGLEVVERLKARNCGHVALYRVQWTYNTRQQGPNCLPKEEEIEKEEKAKKFGSCGNLAAD